jgi:hypothetical protein
MVHEVLREMRIGVLPKPTTTNYDELVVGLVKEIEAQREKEALVYLYHLVNGYGTWIWPELAAIGAGITGDGLVTSVLSHVCAATVAYFEQRKGYEAVFPAFAILVLCRSDLSRTTSGLYHAAKQIEKLAIPDYALDMHTARGKHLKRGFEHFITVGSHLENVGYESRYTFYDPVHGTASVGADNVTKFPEPYKVSDALETGRKGSSNGKQKEPSYEPVPEQEILF